MNKSFRELFFCLVASFVFFLTTGALQASMTIQSLNGAVTETEISSFTNFMAGETPADTALGNVIADGTSGMEAEALGMMYEVTNMPVLLNQMIACSDDFLSLRNNTNNGQIMWDGLRDPVWLTYAATNADAGYAGSENNDTAGHIAYCAQLILETPSLWNVTVPDGDPYGNGATYYERAQTYIAQMDYTQAAYMLKWFIQPGTDLIVAPTNAAWVALNENVNAYNRQMMFLNGFQRLSECHQLLGDNPALVTLYDGIVKAQVDVLLAGQTTTTTNGHLVNNWDYAPGDGSDEDNTLHSTYDIWGLTRAWAGGRYGLTNASMVPFANTLQYVMNVSTNHISYYVDGSSTGQSIRNFIYPGWMPISDFSPATYAIMANMDIAQGSQASTAIYDAMILWVKNARYLGNYPTNNSAVDYTISTPWIENVTVGSNTTCKVTVNPLEGFNSSVTLGVTGLPSGVTASFSPSSISGGSGSSTLTLTASSSATPGIYSLGSIVITGSGGSIDRISPLTLVVDAAPNFSLSGSPSSQNITIGGSTSYTIDVSSLNGFSGTVALSVSGLPANASGGFSPSSVSGGSGTSTLNITTATNTPSGNYPLTVTGVSGDLTNTASVTLLLNDFSISATPSSQTVTAGGSTNYTVTVGNINGFGGTVDLSANGLPSGATASFNPTSIDSIGSSTLTIATTSTMAASTNTVTITGASGSLEHGANVSLIVQPTTTSFAGTFEIQNVTSGLALNQGGLTTNGSPITQWTWVSSPNEEFTFIATSNGYYQINSVKSGLDVAVQGAGTTNNAPLVQWAFGSSGDDQWKPVENSNGTWAFYNLHSGLTLNNSGGSATNNSQYSQWSWASSPNEEFNLIRIPEPVNLSSAFNREGMVTDGTTFSSTGGLDGNGYAYSSTLLGTSVTNSSGVKFNLGAANASNVVSSSGQTITLPAGNFSTLQMVATAVNGGQASETFTVTYTDNSTSTFTQSLSDWGSSQGYTGETVVSTMAYRDGSSGSTYSGTWDLYGYVFDINNAKTVSSVTLPADSNVVILGLTLEP